MNLFDLSKKIDKEELLMTLFETTNLRIERIVSAGETTDWYDQKEDEWLVLIDGSAVLEYEDGQTKTLNKGDFLLIPAGHRHKVIFTSTEPPCIWITVFFPAGDTHY